MKKIKLIVSAICIIAGVISFKSYAQTREELLANHQAAYTAGAESVYGPALTQDQLNSLSATVADFTSNNITEFMSEEERIRTIHSYLCSNVSYASSWRENSANTAYGALINKTAQCSGYARAFKALCDAAGVECYYVHANSNAINPSHQWNIVKYNDEYYHVDVQVNDDAGEDVIYLTALHPCSYDQSEYPLISLTDAPIKRN